MRHIFLIFVLLGLYLPAQSEVSYSRELQEIFNRLDEMILQKDDYHKAKEESLQQLKMRLNRQTTLEEMYLANKMLYEEYYVYNADSAMLYVERNLEIARRTQRMDWLYTWKINKSFLYSATGLLTEAANELDSIPVKDLPNGIKTDYYGQMLYLWSHYGQYTGDKDDKVRRIYHEKELLYRDSLNQVAEPGHPLYLWYKGCSSQFQGADSMRVIIPALEKAVRESSLNTRYDAMNAYILGCIYRDLDDMNKYCMNLAYSSMADIVSCNKDIASLEELGIYLLSLGDIDRAYSYINYCLQNALFFKNRVRIAGLSGTIYRINAIYKERLHSYGNRLEGYLTLVCILSVVLLLAIAYIYNKLRELSVSKTKLHDMNDELHKNVSELLETKEALKVVNAELEHVNLELKDVNAELRNSNYLKEEYIGAIFAICSNYISKLEDYRKKVNRKVKTKQIEEVIAMTDRPMMLQNELKEFYQNFDTIFLRLYPNFVQDFNALMRPEEQIVLKEGELLNTELRIYALVRLGITDSVRIAEFLHCSAQTVYNNRLRVRNKSIVPKEKLVEAVQSLGKEL